MAQAQAETEVRQRCSFDGYLIQRDGTCWFCGRKAEKPLCAEVTEDHSNPQAKRENDETGGDMEDVTVTIEHAGESVPMSESDFIDGLKDCLVDRVTGEIPVSPGRLTLCGLDVSAVEMQRRAKTIVAAR